MTIAIVRIHKCQSLFGRNSVGEIGSRNGLNHRFIMIDIMNPDHCEYFGGSLLLVSPFLTPQPLRSAFRLEFGLVLPVSRMPCLRSKLSASYSRFLQSWEPRLMNPSRVLFSSRFRSLGALTPNMSRLP